MGNADPRHNDLDRSAPGGAPVLDRELDRAVEETTIRLKLDLGEVIATHGLSKSELMMTHRAVGRLARSGLAPTLDDFWAATALPRAAPLLEDARRVIDHELDRLAENADRHQDRSADSGGMYTQPLIVLGSAARRSAPIAVVEEVERRLAAALPSNGPLDDLGLWWLRRLRRAALVRALPALLGDVPAAARMAIANREMQLLLRPPWSHGDRLLSAFELAHADLRRYGRHRIAATSRRLRSPVPC